MCTMRFFCVVVFQMCSNRKMNFGKVGAGRMGGVSAAPPNLKNPQYHLCASATKLRTGKRPSGLPSPVPVTAKDIETQRAVAHSVD